MKTDLFHPPLFYIVLGSSVSKEAYNDVVSCHSCVEKNGEIVQRACASLKCKYADYSFVYVDILLNRTGDVHIT